MKYTKLNSSILTSTLWLEDSDTRIAWVALMAMADKNGEVQATVPGLAHVARIPLDKCGDAICAFLSPDQLRESNDDEGRRIEKIKGGWRLINYAKHNSLSELEARREKAAERAKRHQLKARLARNSVQ